MKTKVAVTLICLGLGGLTMESSFAQVMCIPQGGEVSCMNSCPVGAQSKDTLKVSVARHGVQRVSYLDTNSNYQSRREQVSSLNDPALLSAHLRNQYKLACGDSYQFKSCAETQLDTKSLQKTTSWTPCAQALKFEF